MRRTIRLTGRRDLPRAAVRLTMTMLNGRPLVTFAIVDRAAFAAFPPQAKLSLKLSGEKGIVEAVDLGTVMHPRASASVQSASLVDPSCELRVVDVGNKAKGLLLASTTLPLRGDGEGEGKRLGILDFLADKIAPQTWKLQLRADDRPVVYIDDRIPQSAHWARTDPVFVAVALPAIVRQVLGFILDLDDPAAEEGWVADWLRWVDDIMPGTVLPTADAGDEQREDWLDKLLDSFCTRHDTAGPLLAQLAKDDAQ